MSLSQRSVVRVLTLAFVLSCPSAIAQEVVTTPGQANLEIKITSTAPEILAYLNSQQVVVDYWTEERLPVRLYRLGESQPAVRADYVPSVTQPDPLATKVVLPEVPEAGSDFVVQVNSLVFDSGAAYRIGTADAGYPASITCGPVLRLADDADGTTCEVSECAALLNVNVSLVGEEQDLGALDDFFSVYCSASAWVEEQFMSGAFDWQASSGSESFDLDELSSGNAQIQMLVRGDGSRTRVVTSCTARVKEGETGFVLLPGSRQTPLVRTVIETPSCDDVSDVDMPLTVERNAGVLKGLFDISGRTETDTSVMFVHQDIQFEVEPPPVSASSVPDPDVQWIFEGAPATCPLLRHDVSAAALVDDGFRYLVLPHKRGLNHGVEVPLNGATGLGSTFVSMPHPLTGMVVVDDRAAGIGLEELNVEPFTYLSSYLGRWSFLSATGRPEIAPGGKSGDGGRSLSILQGNYDPDEGKAELSYELLLAGLSDPGGPTNGRGAKPTPWLVDELQLYFNSPDDGSRQRLSLGIGMLLPRTTSAIPETGDLVPIEPIPELHLCLAEVSVTFKTDPDHAMLYSPSLRTWQEGWILTVPDDPYSLFEINYNYASGTPVSVGDRAEEATVSMRLPAGSSYHVYPSVAIAAPDGSTSNWVYLNSFDLPASGLLECGSSNNPCVETDEEGESSILSVWVAPPIPTCSVSEDIAFNAFVQSGTPVTSLTLKIDSNAEQTLCAPCSLVDGVSDPIPVTANIPADDSYHTVVLKVTSNGGCDEATHEAQVWVPSRELALECAPDFPCVVDAGEIPLPHDHSCIASNLTDANRVGGCNFPVWITDDRPATFPAGTTDVDFTGIPGMVSCTTTVTVEQLPGYQLAYVEGESLKVRDVDSGLDLMNRTIPSSATWLEFDAEGERLAVALSQSGPAFLVFDVDTDSLIYGIDAPATRVGSNVEFNPIHPEVLATQTLNREFGRYWIGLYRNGIEQAAMEIPRSLYMSEPEISWNEDGRLLAAITSYPNLGPTGNQSDGYKLRLHGWDVLSDLLDNPRIWEAERNDNPRGEPFKLIHRGGDLGRVVFASIRGISEMRRSNLTFIKEIGNDHIDIALRGELAVFLKDSAAGLQISTIQVRPTIVLIGIGPTIAAPGGSKAVVELSDDGKRAAVSADGRIYIFDVRDLSPITTIIAGDVRLMRFRPWQAEDD